MPRRSALRDPWVWGQTLLAAAVLFGVPYAARRGGILDPGGVTRWLGLALIGIGLGVLGAGIAALGRNLTPATEPLPGGELVTRGVYGIVRHPIYLGVSTILAGYGVWRGGWGAGAAAFTVALAYFECKARVEERFLVQRMQGYEVYQRRVPRLLPGGWH
jgi:protein-S-isoprenylcysteine O-methyltransferase Ste14